MGCKRTSLSTNVCSSSYMPLLFLARTRRPRAPDRDHAGSPLQINSRLIWSHAQQPRTPNESTVFEVYLRTGQARPTPSQGLLCLTSSCRVETASRHMELSVVQCPRDSPPKLVLPDVMPSLPYDNRLDARRLDAPKHHYLRSHNVIPASCVSSFPRKRESTRLAAVWFAPL